MRFLVSVQCLRFSAIVTLGLGNVACSPAVSHAQAGSGCRAPDSVKVPAHLEYLTSIVVGTDSVALETRAAFQLQATTSNKVALVTRNSTCASAAAALNTVAGTPGVVRQVWVYTLGNNYAVEDPTIPIEPLGEYPIYLFDRNWNPKPVLMY